MENSCQDCLRHEEEQGKEQWKEKRKGPITTQTQFLYLPAAPAIELGAQEFACAAILGSETLKESDHECSYEIVSRDGSLPIKVWRYVSDTV